jgi:hypothetical protein
MLVPDAETIADATDLARDINQTLLVRSLHRERLLISSLNLLSFWSGNLLVRYEIGKLIQVEIYGNRARASIYF